MVVIMWGKLRAWFEEMREERDHDRFAERFQWLAERFAEHPVVRVSGPAYSRCASWRPTADGCRQGVVQCLASRLAYAADEPGCRGVCKGGAASRRQHTPRQP